jgi:hypothetical protein
MPTVDMDRFPFLAAPPESLLIPGKTFPARPDMIKGDIVHALTEANHSSCVDLLDVLGRGILTKATVLWCPDQTRQAFQVQGLINWLAMKSRVLLGAAVSEPGSLGTGYSASVFAEDLDTHEQEREDCARSVFSVSDGECEDLLEGALGGAGASGLVDAMTRPGELPGRGSCTRPFLSNDELWELPHLDRPWFEAVEPGCPIVIDHPKTLMEYVLSAEERTVAVVVFGTKAFVAETESVLERVSDAGKWNNGVGVHCMTVQSGTGALKKTRVAKTDTRRSTKRNGDIIQLVLTPDQLTIPVAFLICVIQEDFAVETMAMSSCMKASTFNSNMCMVMLMENLKERLNPFGTLVILSEKIDDIATVFCPRSMNTDEFYRLSGASTVGAAVSMTSCLEKKPHLEGV